MWNRETWSVFALSPTSYKRIVNLNFKEELLVQGAVGKLAGSRQAWAIVMAPPLTLLLIPENIIFSLSL